MYQGIGNATNLSITGCNHATVGPIVRGSYTLVTENHGRKAYKRDAQVNGLDVMIYFWDERDGANFCGWWFGPKIGGDQVWAYHSDKSAQTPPTQGWKVPYDGEVDNSLVIAAAGAAAAGQQQAAYAQAAQMQQQQQMAAQQQQQQQMQQMQRMQQLKQQQEQQRAQMAAMQAQATSQQRTNLQQTGQIDKVAAMRQQQEEFKRKKEEAQAAKDAANGAKKLEQASAIQVRRGVYALKAANLQNIDAARAEFEKLYYSELPNCGAQTAMLTELMEKIKAEVDEKMSKLEAAHAKQKEALQKAQDLIEELHGMVESLAADCESVKEKAKPFVSDTPILTDAQVSKAATVFDLAAEAARAKAKECSTFAAQKNQEMKLAEAQNTSKSASDDPADAPKPTLKACLTKISELTKVTEVEIKKANAGKEKAVKMAAAKLKLAEVNKVFKKYDKNNDGALNRAELLNFAKMEYKFTLSAADTDAICKVLIPAGAKGVTLDKFHRLKAYIGTSREKALDIVRKADREQKEKDVAEKKEGVTAKAEEAAKGATTAEEKVKAMEELTNPFPAKSKTMSAKDTLAAIEEIETKASEAKEAIEEARNLVKAISEDVPDEVKGFATTESAKITNKLKPLDMRVTKGESVVTKAKADAQKKDAIELELLRGQALKMIRFHQQEKKLKTDDLYAQMDKNKDDKVDETEFTAFFEGCSKDPEAGEKGSIASDDLVRLFKFFLDDGEDSISKDSIMSWIAFYMKVLKETIATDGLDLKASTPVRRLEIGEMCTVVEGPLMDEGAEVKRVCVKMMKDDVQGWVTPVGNQGTIFLQERALQMKVVKETILTSSFEIAGTEESKDATRKLKDNTRKLKVGELLEVREWMKKEESSGLMRMKVKAKSDGQIGWATATSSTGQAFLEAA